MSTKKIKVALLGVGTVGTGVYKLIQRRAGVMVQTIGAELEVTKILVHNMSCPTNEHYKYLENLIHYLVNM